MCSLQMQTSVTAGPDSFNAALTFTLSQRGCVTSPERLIVDWKPNKHHIQEQILSHTLVHVSQSQGCMGLTCSCTHTRCVRLAEC